MPSKKSGDKSDKKMKIKVQRGVIPFLGVAAAIFVVTIAFYFLFDRLAKDAVPRTAVTGWEYTYSDTPEVVYNNDSMRIYNSQNPIITGELRHDYIYFVRTFEGSETDRTLTILTDHSPIRIFVAGYEVYNNHFSGDGSEQYVGNCYNSIVLEGNERDQQVEIFMRLPFAERFEVTQTDGSQSRPFILSGTLIFCGVLFAACVLGMFISLIICAKRKNKSRLPGGFALLAFAAAADALYNAPDCTYLLNDPIWVNICAAAMFSVFFVCILILSGESEKKAKLRIATVIAWAISAAALIFFREPNTILLASLLSALLAAPPAAALAWLNYHAVVSRTQYATGLFVTSVYYALSILFAGGCMYFRATGAFRFTLVLSTGFAAVMAIVVDSASLRFHEEKKALEETSRRHGECVDKLAAFIRNVLSHRSLDELLRFAPGEVADLVRAYYGNEVEVYYSAAIRDGENYTELLSEGIEDCNYHIIEGNCRRELRDVLFFGSYFDYSFTENGKRIIFHFEGFDCVSDPFFTDMLESAYSGLETAIEHIENADAEGGALILLKLAQKAEADDGYTPRHLENVGAMAKLLAISLGLGDERAETIADASRFHDIGKMAIPRSITMKEGRLSPEEREIVNEHTEYGYKILSAFSDDDRLALAAEIARYHHERYDGGGRYNLAGEDIPIEGRIVMLCDIFDALTTPRRYKRQWSLKEAMNYVRDGAKKQFDPEIAKAFEALAPQIEEIKKER